MARPGYPDLKTESLLVNWSTLVVPIEPEIVGSAHAVDSELELTAIMKFSMISKQPISTELS